MADYFVNDDNAGPTYDGASWATAYTSIDNGTNSLVASVPAALTTSGNRIWLGDDHVETYSGGKTFTGPTSGAPVVIVSCDKTNGTPTYKAASTAQIVNSTSGTLNVDGSFAFFGVGFRNDVGQIQLNSDKDEYGYFESCLFDLRWQSGVNVYANTASGGLRFVDCTFAVTDSGANIYSVVSGTTNTNLTLQNCTFTGLSNRTYVVFGGPAGLYASGLTFSDLPAATEICNQSAMNAVLCNIRRDNAGDAVFSSGGADSIHSVISATNFGTSNLPHYMEASLYGRVWKTSTSVTRTNGASIGGQAFSWYVASGGNEYAPTVTPWIYGTISSAGTKTFTIHAAGSSDNLDNSKAWVEVEYLDTSNEAHYGRASGHRVITASAGSAYTTDSETWATTPTYRQAVSVSGVAVQAGLFRARMCLGALTGTLYVDPEVTVA